MKGGSSAPTQQNITQTNIPAYARPYFERMMDRGEALSLADYTPYEGQRLADQSGDTSAAFDMTRNIAGQGIAGMPEAMNIFGSNAQAGQNIANAANPFQFSASGFSAADSTAGQFDPTRTFDSAAAQQYMSPYIQNVLQDQMANQRRQFDISQGDRDAQAVRIGAFGGSRQAVQQSLAEDDLQRNMGQTFNQGLQSAYTDAQGMFQADRGAQFSREQAQIAENARAQGLGAQELGRVQAGDAGEQARVQGSQADENARATQERLQAMGFSAEQAQQMLGAGELDRATGIQNAQLLEALGMSQEARQQAGLDIAYQDFVRQQAYPEQQLQMMSSILRGVPIENSTTTTAYAPNNTTQQVVGAGLQGIGLYQGLTA